MTISRLFPAYQLEPRTAALLRRELLRLGLPAADVEDELRRLERARATASTSVTTAERGERS